MNLALKSRPAALLVLLWFGGNSRADDPGRALFVVIKAGPYDREGMPVRFEVPADRFGPAVREAIQAGPVAVGVTLDPLPPGSFAAGTMAQVGRGSDDSRAVITLSHFEMPKSGAMRYRIGVDTPVHLRNAQGQAVFPFEGWSFRRASPGSLDLRFGDRPVFTYNASPVSSPKYGPIQARDAYIHPAYSPSGALVTGDFSSSHPHHRGFFLAYERTRWGDLTPDFWNIHVGTGKIHADGLDEPVVGPFTVRFSARHRWEAKDKATGKGTVVLRERWDVEAYHIPGSPYRLFDLTSTQQAVDHPLEILPYRYGGMAYRGPEPFVKGTLDVLTSEGKHRKDGDQKPARWVDLTGPVAEGSDLYAGAMIADHPSNPRYPNVARIHPTSLPFFCFVPAYDKPLTIAVDAPTVFRYRMMIHDGRPDPALDERVARYFAEPPEVVVE